MIVTMTAIQARYLDSVIGDGALAETMHTDRVAVSERKLEITAPFVAWEIVNQLVMERYLSRTLGRTRDTPDAVLRLLTAIAKSNNKYVRHPVWRASAVVGMADGWFPAWRFPTPIDEYVYSPRPVFGGQFMVLGPEFQTQERTQEITVWTQFGIAPRSHWLASENAHTRLVAEHG